MKKILVIILALVFASGILGISVVKASLSPTPTTIVIEEPKSVDYFLAYPGILPDNILYPIKMIRDRIWLSLTSDPLKKAEVLLLFADKRLGAAKALIDGNKQDKGITTLTKAEKYLDQAIAQEKVAANKGKDTGAFKEKLIKAQLKHEEILLELKTKVDDTGRSVIEDILKK